MSNFTPAANSGVMVVTHVHPQQQGAQGMPLPTAGYGSPESTLVKFLKGEPDVLGTVQIMIGVIVFLFGFVSVVYPSSVSLISGIMFWGPIIYVTAGSLTVKASKKISSCVVKASLGMNIVSTITAGISIILYSLDFVIRLYPFYFDHCDYESSRLHHCQRNWEAFVSRSNGIAGVMLVLSLLEFIVSIYVAAFGCRATCTSDAIPQVVYVSNQAPPSVPAASYAFPPPCSPEAPYPPSSGVQSIHPNSVAAQPAYMPPVYTAS